MERTLRMTHDGADREDADARTAWSLVQIGRLAEAVEELGARIRALLEPFDPDELQDEGGVAFPADRWHVVMDDVCALRDTAEQLGMIGGSFTPRYRKLSVDVDEIGDAATRALTEGASQLWTIELAARLLDYERGFPALADAIEIDPLGCVAGWDDTTVGGLLSAFRGEDAGRAAAVCEAAGVSPEARWASLGWETLVSICAALRRVGTSP